MELNNKKILHFEDEAYIAEMYAGLLQKQGIQYQHYLNPPPKSEELIRLIIMEKPDVVIMDVMMPHMDGFKAAEILKTNEQTKNIPIIGMSNMWQTEEIKKALNAGMVDFWGKVFFKPSEIVNLIVDFLEQGDNYKPRCKKYLYK
ncbi:MAG: response regulator [Patescibacteria group bacterium]|nr:response regulator [Patescibacteria group bacterium]